MSTWVRRGVTQPLPEPVAADDAGFLADKGAFKIGSRVLRRRAGLLLSGQTRLLANRIEPAWKRSIWFHDDAPQVGDSLMDLAPRSLLVAHGIVLDLVAPAPVAALFAGDRWLRRVSTDAREIDPGDYDFAIVDRSTLPALASKRAVAARLPWVSIQGDYLAYDFHRSCFATRRLAALLGIRLSGDDERVHSRQKLERSGEALPASQDPPRVAFALGGVHGRRTYRHWAEVASRLVQSGCASFALLGSGNDGGVADEVRAALDGVDVLDLVGIATLQRTQRAIAESAVIVCADGGLMHLACTTATPVVALFDASVDPAWRLPLDFRGTALRADERRVDAIAPSTIAAEAIRAMALADQTD